MAKIRTIALGAAGIAALVGFYWVTYARPTAFCAFLQRDAMDAAFCGTYQKLEHYTEQPEAALAWLLANHGEAPSHQVMIGLLRWSYGNRDDFIDLLSRMGDEDFCTFNMQFTFAVIEMGQSDRFRQAFASRKHDSGRLREVLALLPGKKTEGATHRMSTPAQQDCGTLLVPGS